MATAMFVYGCGTLIAAWAIWSARPTVKEFKNNSLTSRKK